MEDIRKKIGNQIIMIQSIKRIILQNSQRAIVNTPNYGPIFGHGNAYEICLFFSFLSNDIQIKDSGDYGDKNLILTGKKSRRPVEIELYKVIIN